MTMPPVLWRFGPFGLGFGAGALMAQGLAPVAFAWAGPLALYVVAVLFRAIGTAQRAGWLGWVFGAGYFSVGLSWITEPFQVDAAAHGWMAPFALVGLAGGLALFWALAFWCAAGLARGGWSVVALVGTWSLAELARAYVLTGFPWAGLAQLALPGDVVLRLVPWVGAQGAGLLLLLSVLPLVYLRPSHGTALIPGAAVAVLAIVAAPPDPKDLPRTDKTARLVQPNAPQDEKWRPEKRWLFVDRMLQLTAARGDGDGREGTAVARPDLVIWPETAIPTLQNHIEDVTPALVAAAGGAELLYGIQREENGRYYNSAVVMSAEGEALDIYDKVHLVPFGEYMPLPYVWERLGVFGLAARAAAGYAPGARHKVLETSLGRALPLICYEGVFAQDVGSAPSRPDFLVLMTNDAWFGTYSGPYQHLVQAQLRAAEQGLPMLRVANTGVSAMIDPYGRIRDFIGLNTSGFIDTNLPLPLRPTFYSRSGDWPVLLTALLLVVGATLAWLRRKTLRILD
ncbi:apolipoprotein N-acyltransferase [Phaeobacter sp. B1627]|uniref:apolipoprotein N-acyltransferase n=1 Tax=Phaeobacter sp. B1627 TaxID=2583809 RepID=UPI00111A8B56|nr:apolipoprotein N-acyltransferase [Phaeobacter sp. B1627]TNJ39979.1 apolipoprotein N-acyltransferase [Phaeobacter sp. B1627]